MLLDINSRRQSFHNKGHIKMWFLLIFIICINTQSSYGSSGKPASDCILPPQPKHGHYEVLETEILDLKPGAKLSNFTLQVTCDPGYHLTESLIYWCENGRILGVSQEMPECLPYCSKVKTDVLSCGLGDKDQESRCLIPDQFFDVGSRAARPMDEELDCGNPGLGIAQIISGGRIVEKKELPWHAGIYTKKTSPYLQICGGSLVTPTIVITAAQCFWSNVEKLQPAAAYAVAVGKIYRPWNNQHDEKAQKSDVEEIKIPPRFHGATRHYQDDIALVKVATPFIFTDSVKPVCLDFDVILDSKQLSAGQLGKVAGWGLTSDNGRESPVLQVGEMPIININECIEKSDTSFRPYITSDKICAGYQNGMAYSVCKGDSGGGLSFPEDIRGTTRYFLRGIVSTAPRRDDLCNTHTLASFTHILKHEHFIRQTIAAKTFASVAAPSR